jgi:hypothetical protein
MTVALEQKEVYKEKSGLDARRATAQLPSVSVQIDRGDGLEFQL